MKEHYLLRGETAETLYRAVQNEPIYDYHCHLSPREIFEDEPFDNIGQMWLGGDHYKWRLMRQAGAEERVVTGSASWEEKFRAYAAALERAAGNPLYQWSEMELAMYFGVTEPLTAESAGRVWEAANRQIRQRALSPRKLIAMSNVRLIATTDDVADSLEWHKRIAADAGFHTAVLPSFRTDNAMNIRGAGYADYIRRLSDAAGLEIHDLDTLKQALLRRLDFFVRMGCRVTDVGIPAFPDRVAPEAEAAETFRAALAGAGVSDAAYRGFLGNLFLFLGAAYRQRNLVMQWHMAVQRNVNGPLFSACGPDTGGDCVGDAIPLRDLAAMLGAIHSASGLPKTVLYTLNPSMYPGMVSVAGSFPGCVCGTAWWFCDHKRGIENAIETVAEESNLGAFLGMLTDSRSFLSYARHDFFRRIFCSVLAGWIDAGEYPMGDGALRLARDVCGGNTARLLGL